MNFDDLNKLIAEQPIGVSRITDIPAGKYSIEIISPENAEPSIYLTDVANKAKRYRTSVASLASMRIVQSKDDAVKVTTNIAARNADGYKLFQESLLKDNVKLSKDSTFEVVHHLEVMDNDAPTVHIYKEEAYNDFANYRTKRSKVRTDFPAEQRRDKYQELTASLRKSGVDATKDGKPEWFLRMPVFRIV